jgi:4-carboxymuconolactone decarboxylase
MERASETMNDSHNARLQRALTMLAKMDSGGRELVATWLDGIAPDFARMATEFAFGDIYSRPGLDLRSRQVATIAALTVLGHADQLKFHIGVGIRAGLTQNEVVEIIMQMGIYGGFPLAVNGLRAAKELFIPAAG